jgi:hypothetical protein
VETGDDLIYGLMTPDPTQLIGEHPQSFAYYFGLVAGTFRTMLDVGMLALGTGTVGLTVAVVLDAFDIVDIGLPLSTSTLLGSALVVGVVGAFALGIASEGGYGAQESVRAYPSLEVALGRLVAAVVVGVILMAAAAQLEEFVMEFSLPIRAAHEMVRATGAAGAYVVSIVGVPVSHVARAYGGPVGYNFQLPILYVVWAVAAVALYTMPPA